MESCFLFEREMYLVLLIGDVLVERVEVRNLRYEKEFIE